MMSIENSSARIIQKIMRGYLVRKEIQIKSVTPGVIHIHIKGHAATLEKIGIYGINSNRGVREINVLSIAPDLFNGRVVGGDRLFNVVKAAPKDADSISSELVSVFGLQKTVYINAGYFNASCYYPSYPNHAAIGCTKTPTNKQSDVVPIPQEYKKDYIRLSFADGSCVSLAPVFTSQGKIYFDDENAYKSQYQAETLLKKRYTQCPPGALYHANIPNPRAGIILPGTIQSDMNTRPNAAQDRIRLAIATSTSRGPYSNGFTLFEWRNTLIRFNQLNVNEGSSINLDGGSSVVMGVIDEGKKVLELSQEKDGRYCSTFLAFSTQ